MESGAPQIFSLTASRNDPHDRNHTVISVALVVFMTGLVLGVFAMLHGTERRVHPALAPHERNGAHDPASEPSPLFNLASIAAFSVGFGFTAYLVARNTVWPLAAQLVVAAISGALALGLQSVLIARWAIPGARAEHVDERYLLQGTIGRVTRAWDAGNAGEMRYALDDREYVLPARSLDDSAVAADVDVVIDRVEHGVAYIELWANVEQRL